MRTRKIVDFAGPTNQRVKLKESEMNKYVDLARELKKTLEHKYDMKVTFILIIISSLRKRTGGLGNKRMCGDYSNNYIIDCKIEKLSWNENPMRNIPR